MADDAASDPKSPRPPSDDDVQAPNGDQDPGNDHMGSNDGSFPDYMTGSVLVGKWIPINKKNWNDIDVTADDSILDCPSQVVPLMIKKPDLFPVKMPKIEVKIPKKKIRINEYGEEEEYDLEDGEEEDLEDEEVQTEQDEAVKAAEVEKKKQEEALKEAKRATTMLTIPDYYKSAVGNMLLGIGLSRATEWFHKDAIKSVHKAIRKEGEQDELVDELKRQTRLYTECKQANSCFVTPPKKCPNCDFKTESSVGLEYHMSIPHLSTKREYKCNYCPFSTRDPRTILFHFQSLHNRPCVIEPPAQLYECPCCQYESSQKQKAAAHVAKCMKFFNPDKVQYVADPEHELPAVTPKPITKTDITLYESTLAHLREVALNPSAPIPDTEGLPRGLQSQMLTMVQQQLAQQAKNRPKVILNRPGMVRPGGVQPSPQQGQQPGMAQQRGIGRLGLGGIALQKGQAMGANKVDTGKGGTFVICEICDGYIKDLEQLRTHMQWIHKVKIHPKMLASRPPLNCQKCQWRFFTDQGLERHLLGAHGLVTSNMQDMVNQNNDSGRCTVCGRVFANKLVAHMNQIHKVTLKPAHLSYKCTVCSATFNLYRLFESHVYMVHSGSVKRTATGADGQSLMKKEKLSGIDSENINANSNGTSEICSVVQNDRRQDQDEQPSVSSNGTEEISLDESGDIAVKTEIENEDKTCEICTVTMKTKEYTKHVLEKHVSSFDVGLCQIESCSECIGKNDGVIIRCGTDEDNKLLVDEGESDSEESIDDEKLVEMLNKDFENPYAHCMHYSNPGEKLHTNIKYKTYSKETGPFNLVKPIPPAYKEHPSWNVVDPTRVQNQPGLLLKVQAASGQSKGQASSSLLLKAQNLVQFLPKGQFPPTMNVAEVVAKLLASATRSHAPSTSGTANQKRAVPEVIDL